MAVLRVVANIAAQDIEKARAFYEDDLGMEVVMDHGCIVTFASKGEAPPQISVAREGGSGTPVPDLSIEVDNFDETLRRVVARGLAIEYGPAQEPWGVRRFYVRDPLGKLVNILAHE